MITPVQRPAPRFAGLVDRAMPAAKWYLHDLEQAGESAAKQLLIQEPKGPLQKAWNTLMDSGPGEALRLFTQWDYNRVVSGDWLMQTAMGGIVFQMFGTILPMRLFQAWQRADRYEDGSWDKREFYDVLRRDVPTLLLLVFALDPLRDRVMMPLLEKIGRIRLHQPGGGPPLDFRQLADTYGLQNAGQLVHLLEADPRNREGIHDAVRLMPTFGLEALNDAKQTVTHHVRELVEAIETGLGQPERLARAGRVLATLDEMNGFRNGLRETMAHSYDVRAKFVQKPMLGLFRKYYPDYRKFMARYAQLMRLPADALAFTTVLGLLGYGVVAFNDFWNRHQWQRAHAKTQGLDAVLQLPGLGKPQPALPVIQDGADVSPFSLSKTGAPAMAATPLTAPPVIIQPALIKAAQAAAVAASSGAP